jgi:hypothetical protein
VYNDPGYFFGGYSLMPGRVVYVGMTLFNLVNPDKMEARCFVLEKDAGELKAEQKVTLTTRSLSGYGIRREDKEHRQTGTSHRPRITGEVLPSRCEPG